MARSKMKRNAVTLLLRVSKELKIRKRAWKKVRKYLRGQDLILYKISSYDILDKMTEILKAERRQR